jgi:hypothetical protein
MPVGTTAGSSGFLTGAPNMKVRKPLFFIFCAIAMSPHVLRAGLAYAISSDPAVACREVQRDMQLTFDDRVTGRGNPAGFLKDLKTILRDASRRYDLSAGCGYCIYDQFADRTPVREQTPCDYHDVCVRGDALGQTDDACGVYAL